MMFSGRIFSEPDDDDDDLSLDGVTVGGTGKGLFSVVKSKASIGCS